MRTVDFARLNLQEGDRVLDLGCGEGRHMHAVYFAKEKIQAVGVDLLFQDVQKARQGFLDFPDLDPSSTRSFGFSVGDALKLAEEMGASAFLINCSRPEAVSQAIPLLKGATMPVGAYANGFTRITEAFKSDAPKITDLSERHDLGPDAYADFCDQWADDGATIIGGCCEVGPAHITEMAKRLKHRGAAA